MYACVEDGEQAIFDRSGCWSQSNSVICLLMILLEGDIDVYDGLLLKIIDRCYDISVVQTNIMWYMEYSFKVYKYVHLSLYRIASH